MIALQTNGLGIKNMECGKTITHAVSNALEAGGQVVQQVSAGEYYPGIKEYVTVENGGVFTRSFSMRPEIINGKFYPGEFGSEAVFNRFRVPEEEREGIHIFFC